MKILHTEWMGVRGGQGLRVIEDLKIIRELGYTPYLACKPNEWLYNEAIQEGIEVVPVAFLHNADIKTCYKLYRFIRDKKVDIVHTHSSKDSYVSTLAAKLAGVKVVRSRHMDLTKKPGLIYKMADMIVTTGEKVKREFIENDFDESRIISIPSYPDENRFQQSKAICEDLQKSYKTEGMFVIGTMTGLNLTKRPLLLVSIIKDIVKKHPQLKLLIAGKKYDDQMKKLMKMIEKYHLEKNVTFVGYVVPEEFLNIIDVYVCPSETEGVPQSLMQAMMMGKAAISTDVGSVRDLNLNDNLIIVDKNDKDALKDALVEIIENDTLRKVLSDKNSKNMRICCSRSVMKKKMKWIYEAVMQNKNVEKLI